MRTPQDIINYVREELGFTFIPQEEVDFEHFLEHPDAVPGDVIRLIPGVIEEVIHSRTKYPTNRQLMGALIEEAGECTKALFGEVPNANVTREAIQVAAVALRIATEGDADFGYKLTDFTETENQ